jgi:hypothetical protein
MHSKYLNPDDARVLLAHSTSCCSRSNARALLQGRVGAPQSGFLHVHLNRRRPLRRRHGHRPRVHVGQGALRPARPRRRRRQDHPAARAGVQRVCAITRVLLHACYLACTNVYCMYIPWHRRPCTYIHPHTCSASRAKLRSRVRVSTTHSR